MSRLSLVVSLLIGLSGCALAPKNYIEPASGPTARLVIRGPGDTFVAFYNSAAMCTGRSFIFDIGRGATKTVKVKANELLALTFNQPGPNYGLTRTRCNVTVSFVPGDGQTYEAQVATLATGQGCAVHILKRDRNGDLGNTSVLTFQRKEKTLQMTENSDFCEPL